MNGICGKERLKSICKAVGIFSAAAFTAFLISFATWIAEREIIYPLKYREEIFEVSVLYEVEPALIFAVVKTESGFRATAESEKGAMGLMQITKDTAAYIAALRGIEDYDIKDAKTNLNFGAYYIRYLGGKFYGIYEIAAAYNAGEGRVKEWLKDKRYSKDGVTLYNIPYEETARYADKICRATNKYKKLYGKLLDKQKNFE